MENLERTIIAIVIANVIVLVRGVQIIAIVIVIANVIVIAISFRSSQYMEKEEKMEKKHITTIRFLDAKQALVKKNLFSFNNCNCGTGNCNCNCSGGGATNCNCPCLEEINCGSGVNCANGTNCNCGVGNCNCNCDNGGFNCNCGEGNCNCVPTES